ncbi:hypothetical protein ACTMTI_51250 [Nonomuraea sp. H19]|uniref:hypothetical protein n=1 Tax=Nonomuraea sp. H19 TaxID=3452206 RepID=UPI003F8B615B
MESITSSRAVFDLLPAHLRLMHMHRAYGRADDEQDGYGDEDGHDGGAVGYDEGDDDAADRDEQPDHADRGRQGGGERHRSGHHRSQAKAGASVGSAGPARQTLAFDRVGDVVR